MKKMTSLLIMGAIFSFSNAYGSMADPEDLEAVAGAVIAVAEEQGAGDDDGNFDDPLGQMVNHDDDLVGDDLMEVMGDDDAVPQQAFNPDDDANHNFDDDMEMDDL